MDQQGKDITIEELTERLREHNIDIGNNIYWGRVKISDEAYRSIKSNDIINHTKSGVARQLIEAGIAKSMRFTELHDQHEMIITITGKMLCMTAQELDDIIEKVICNRFIKLDRPVHSKDLETRSRHKQRITMKGILPFIQDNNPFDTDH